MYTLKGESFFNFNHETHCICYYVREREKHFTINIFMGGWLVGWFMMVVIVLRASFVQHKLDSIVKK